MMLGHLGDRVSALLDGALSPQEEERAWEHVHHCYPCRDRVEHEGWVKTRLAVLGAAPTLTPDHLRHALLAAPGPSDPRPQAAPPRARPMMLVGGSALGASAVGAAVVGILALGASPGHTPAQDRRAPVTSVLRTAPGATPGVDSPSSTPATVVRERVREKIGR